MKNKLRFAIPVIAAAILSIAIYKVGFSNATANTSSMSSGKSFSYTTLDYPTSATIKDLSKSSDIIVSGHYLGFDKSWNMARDPENISQEDSTKKVEGRIYNFKVDKFIKGSGSNSIKVNLTYKLSDGTIFENYEEPKIGNQVVLFLKYDSNFDNYYAPSYPFEFGTDNGKLQLDTHSKSENGQFKDDGYSINSLS